MASFDEILAKLHDNSLLKDTDGVITITPTRQFQIPAEYNSTIAYSGDVNSQIITFKLPLTHEGHSLFDCQYKKIKWKNTTSKTEGFSKLKEEKAEEDGWTCQWEVPPEAMAEAGGLEIAIVLYDLSEENGRPAFVWNTPSYSGFTIGKSFADIGIITESKNIMPAADEILSINSETRMIVAPSGYNNVVALYGDKGISKVYFQADRYIQGIDILESEIVINIKFNSDMTDQINTSEKIEMTKNGSKVLICWDISDVFTNNANYYTGSFTISISFIHKENNQIKKRWTSSAYSSLSIGTSLLVDDIHHVAERDEEQFKTIVTKHIDTYLDDNEFIIEDETY